MTDTAGILENYKDPSTLLAKLDIQQARELIQKGIVAGGMIPKVSCCVRSLAQGVQAAHIIDGRLPHALLLEIFTDQPSPRHIKQMFICLFFVRFLKKKYNYLVLRITMNKLQQYTMAGLCFVFLHSIIVWICPN